MNRSKSRAHLLSIVLLTAMIIGTAASTAQGAESSASDELVSITRDEFLQQLRTHFALEDPQRQGGTVIVTEQGDIITLNGLLASDFPTRYITQLIFEKLATVSPIDGKPVPQLADYWERSSDNRSFTFHINQAAKWHDGVDVTAEDVQFSYEAAMSGLLSTTAFGNLRSQIASTRVVDGDTFELTVTAPTATFLWDIPASISIVPKHVWDSVDENEWQEDPGSTGEDPLRVVGSGPFKFKSWVRGQTVTLVRNEEHYSTVPSIDTFVMKQMGSSEEATALKAGETDVADGIDVRNIASEIETGAIKQESYTTNTMLYYACNTKNPPLDDVMVRQALFMALDREAILRDVSGGYGEVALGTQPPLSFAYAPESIVDPFTYDPERARQLLAQAGWIDTNNNGIVDKNGKELRLTIRANSEIPQIDQLLAQLQRYWRDINVDVSVATTDRWDSILDQILKGELDFDVVIRFKRWPPSGNQGPLFHGNPPGGDNIMGWSNTEYDRLDDEQLHEFDMAKRRDLLIQLSNLAWNEVPVGALRFNHASTAYNSSLHNFHPTELGGIYWSIPFVWKDET